MEIRIFEDREHREAEAWSMAGGVAVHLHSIVFDRSPTCFKAAVQRGERIAHLLDQDAARLYATARSLGVRVIVIERKGRPWQHVDLCGAPLRKLLREVGKPEAIVAVAQEERRMTTVQPPPARPEANLFTEALDALSKANWAIGKCAALWNRHDSRDAADIDLAAKLGVTAGQVQQRRRVWTSFSDIASAFPNLQWSHFHAAMKWEQPTIYLTWANERYATVPEMMAYHSAVCGHQPEDEGEES